MSRQRVVPLFGSRRLGPRRPTRCAVGSHDLLPGEGACEPPRPGGPFCVGCPGRCPCVGRSHDLRRQAVAWSSGFVHRWNSMSTGIRCRQATRDRRRAVALGRRPADRPRVPAPVVLLRERRRLGVSQITPRRPRAHHWPTGSDGLPDSGRNFRGVGSRRAARQETALPAGPLPTCPTAGG
jgi:hypothetical protein